MNEYVIVTENGKRTWMGDDEDHAREQHEDAFPDEAILEIRGGAAARLEEIRTELRAERISYGELAELQGLAEYIEPGDVELLEAAGVPEFPEED